MSFKEYEQYCATLAKSKAISGMGCQALPLLAAARIHLAIGGWMEGGWIGGRRGPHIHTRDVRLFHLTLSLLLVLTAQRKQFNLALNAAN